MSLLSRLLRRIRQTFKTNPASTALICLSGIVFVALLSAFLFVRCCESAEKYIVQLSGISETGVSEKNEALKFLGIGMGGVLLSLQALMSYRRAKALEDTVRNAEQGQWQERLKKPLGTWDMPRNLYG